MRIESEEKKRQREAEKRTTMPREDSLEGHSRKERMAKEREKLRGMNWKQRIGYIWDYYKFVFAGIAVVLVIGSILLSIVRGMGTEIVMQAAFLNCDYLAGDSQTLWDEFEAYLGGLEEDQELDLDFSLSIDPDSMDSATAAATIKVMAYMSDGSLDCMIMPENVYRHYLNNGTFQTLDMVLSPEEMEVWEPYLDSEQTPAEGEPGVYGICMDGASRLTESGLYPEAAGKIYFAFPVGASGTEVSVKLLHFLMGDAPEEQ